MSDMRVYERYRQFQPGRENIQENLLLCAALTTASYENIAKSIQHRRITKGIAKKFWFDWLKLSRANGLTCGVTDRRFVTLATRRLIFTSLLIPEFLGKILYARASLGRIFAWSSLMRHFPPSTRKKNTWKKIKAIGTMRKKIAKWAHIYSEDRYLKIFLII